MDDQHRLRDILERNAKAVTLRPSLGLHTGRTRATLKPGLECQIEDGVWALTVGMGEKSGGNNAGPGPGTFGRGALASCLAMGYAMWGARLGVPINSLQIEVAADYDARGELGISDDVFPGYLKVTYAITIDSPATDAEIMKVIDTGDKYSPYLDVFSRANTMERSVTISRAIP